MGQYKAEMHSCIVINKKDDDRHSTLKNAQKTIGIIMCEKEQCTNLGTEGKKKWKQQVMDNSNLTLNYKLSLL